MKNVVKKYSYESLNRKSKKRLNGLRKNLYNRIKKVDELIIDLYYIDMTSNFNILNVTNVLEHLLKIKRALDCEINKIDYLLYYKKNNIDRNESHIKKDFYLVEKYRLNLNLKEYKPYFLNK